MTQAGDRRAGGVFDDALAALEELRGCGWKETDAVGELAAAMERAGDPRGGSLCFQALAVEEYVSKRFSSWTAVDTIIAAGLYDAVHQALAELDEPSRIPHLVELGTTSGLKDDGRALDYLREARSLCQYVSDEPDRLWELGSIADAMAECGFLHEALNTIRPHHLDRYLGHLAEWASILERQVPGLALQVLCVATEVAAWRYEDWAKIHAIVCESAPKRDPTRRDLNSLTH
jgi:hypothetical protein